MPISTPAQAKANATAKTAAAKTAAKTPRKAAPPQRAVKSPARKVATAPVATPRKPVAKKPVVRSAVAAVKSVETSKIKAPKKPKLIRDSFTMPKDEYQAIDSLKQRATRLLHSAKKSELLRAGIMALSAMDDKHLAAVLARVPALKTGRPSRS